jgi:DNA polymerase III delta subunit
MAKKSTKTDEKLNYPAEIRSLKELGPGRLYFLWGPEDYLREQYLAQLKKLCLPEGEDSFSFRRINGPELDAAELRQAVDAMPFLTERSFAELRDIDLNKLAQSEECLEVISDIP